MGVPSASRAPPSAYFQVVTRWAPSAVGREAGRELHRLDEIAPYFFAVNG